MNSEDLNLLVTLDALLATQSVSKAAEQLGMSAPAVSRALARLRLQLGDPLLVRAGRELVATPKALLIAAGVRRTLDDAREILRRSDEAAAPRGVYTVRTNDAIVGLYAAALAERIARDAPEMVVRFLPEGDEDVEALREGRVHLDVGVIGESGPEIRVQRLTEESLVGVVRAGHAICTDAPSLDAFVVSPHVNVSRKGRIESRIDVELARLGFTRRVSLVVPTWYGAILAASQADLVALVIAPIARHAREHLGMHVFDIPLPLKTFAISQAWHPRFDHDAGVTFLRSAMIAVVATAH